MTAAGRPREGWAEGFPPVEPRRARVLVLGSLPGAESIRRGQYYGHPRNAFWPIMGRLFGAGPNLSYRQRLRKLADHGVMLWDVLRAAERRGSLDAAIHPRRVRANDIAGLLARHPELELIVFNGAAAEALFRRHVLPPCRERLAGMRLVRLPSTSPAHAARSFEEKLALWREGIHLASSALGMDIC
ncbi:MAG TPA: DNA-deoxyinosine glycosylase [Kiritimatiellia bacterium]|nr:DNA-deoxyinosine glycosylase [Kiritimatiellia bacterium]HPJ57937.1 DNA-deoxyinosine glycosylase [Kiritimatiellia bacterium]